VGFCTPKPLTLLDSFRSLDDRTKNILADIDSPLILGLATLTLASERVGVESMSCEHIVAALEVAGVALNRSRLEAAMARAGDHVSRRVIDTETHYSVMTRGRRRAEELLNVGSLDLLYIDGGKPRTARMELKDLLANMSGAVKVCDPYYGIRSLESLEFFPISCQLRFLTARTNESPHKLAGPLHDFKIEHPNTQLRTYPHPNELHDRYILSKDRLLIIGHGLKDIGGKQSFVISIGRVLAPDMMSQLTKEFNSRWSRASPL
jgi:hypothetical protein